MASDPLYDPLGTTPRPEVRRGVGVLTLVVAVLVGAGVTAALMRQTGSSAARSIAVAAIEVAPKGASSLPPPPVAMPAQAPAAQAEASAGGAQAPASIDELNRANGDTVEIQNGVKIIRLGAALSSKSLALPVPMKRQSRHPVRPRRSSFVKFYCG